MLADVQKKVEQQQTEIEHLQNAMEKSDAASQLEVELAKAEASKAAAMLADAQKKVEQQQTELTSSRVQLAQNEASQAQAGVEAEVQLGNTQRKLEAAQQHVHREQGSVAALQEQLASQQVEEAHRMQAVEAAMGKSEVALQLEVELAKAEASKAAAMLADEQKRVDDCLDDRRVEAARHEDVVKGLQLKVEELTIEAEHSAHDVERAGLQAKAEAEQREAGLQAEAEQREAGLRMANLHTEAALRLEVNEAHDEGRRVALSALGVQQELEGAQSRMLQAEANWEEEKSSAVMATEQYTRALQEAAEASAGLEQELNAKLSVIEQLRRENTKLAEEVICWSNASQEYALAAVEKMVGAHQGARVRLEPLQAIWEDAFSSTGFRLQPNPLRDPPQRALGEHQGAFPAMCDMTPESPATGEAGLSSPPRLVSEASSIVQSKAALVSQTASRCASLQGLVEGLVHQSRAMAAASLEAGLDIEAMSVTQSGHVLMGHIRALGSDVLMLSALTEACATEATERELAEQRQQLEQACITIQSLQATVATLSQQAAEAEQTLARTSEVAQDEIVRAVQKHRSEKETALSEMLAALVDMERTLVAERTEGHQRSQSFETIRAKFEHDLQVVNENEQGLQQLVKQLQEQKTLLARENEILQVSFRACEERSQEVSASLRPISA